MIEAFRLSISWELMVVWARPVQFGGERIARVAVSTAKECLVAFAGSKAFLFHLAVHSSLQDQTSPSRRDAGIANFPPDWLPSSLGKPLRRVAQHELRSILRFGVAAFQISKPSISYSLWLWRPRTPVRDAGESRTGHRRGSCSSR